MLDGGWEGDGGVAPGRFLFNWKGVAKRLPLIAGEGWEGAGGINNHNKAFLQ